ncbi:MAG: peptidoglycan DD-metalloendopeptidase family protein [Gammaproteobacteria bacterium]
MSPRIQSVLPAIRQRGVCGWMAQYASSRRWWLICLFALCVSGCIANPLRWDPDTHIVQKGQSLAVLALRYEVRVRDLVAWNKIDNPDRILPGQALRITKPVGWSEPKPTTTRPGLPPPTVASVSTPKRWYWPAKGKLVPNRNDAGVGDGINISATLDKPVFAASNGKVVYSGTGLTGYGKLIIIKHNERYLTAYGYNNSMLVKEGDQVKGGQRIATMGYGPGGVPMLHFEIRRDGKPVKPLNYLSKQ